MLGRAGLPAQGRLVQNQLSDVLAYVDWAPAYAADRQSLEGRRANLAQVASGGGFSLDGINDFINCGNDTTLQITGALTLGAWFKTDNLVGTSVIAKYNVTGSQRGYLIFGGSDQKLNFTVSSDGAAANSVIDQTALKNDDVWHFVAAVYSPSSYTRLYVDGTQVAERTAGIPAAIYNSTADVFIGARTTGLVGNFDGEIAGAFIYAASTSATDIAHCFNTPGALPHEAPGSVLTASDLKGHWPMTEGFQDANYTLVLDHSGNGNHGTNGSGGATPFSPVEEVVPQTGLRGFTRGIRFDGTNDFVSCTTPASNLQSDFTWSVMCYHMSHAAAAILGWQDTANDRIFLRISAGNILQGVVVVGGSIESLSSNYTADVEVAFHLVVTHDTSEKTISFYVDGASQGSVVYTGTLATSGADTFNIGSNNLKGLFDEVVWFDRAFDTTEISELYNSGTLLDARLHSRASDLVGYWRNGWLTSTGDWEDLSTNSNDGAVNGSPDNVILEARPDDPARTAFGGFVRQFAGNAFALAEAGHARLLGANVVSNGDFDDATGWTATSPWLIDAGLASIDGSQAGSRNLAQSATFTDGDYYEVILEIAAYTAGTVTPWVNGTSGTGRTGTGRYTEIIQAGASGGFVLQAGSTFDGSVDNIYVRPVALPNLFAGGGAVSVWIRPITMGGNNVGRIADKAKWRLNVSDESSGACDALFWHDFDGAADGQWSTTARGLTLSSWNHIAIVYNSDAVGNNPTVYVDGTSVAATEDTTPVGSAVSDVGDVAYVGNDAGATNDFDGDIGRIGFFNRELTAAEILRIFQVERSIYGA